MDGHSLLATGNNTLITFTIDLEDPTGFYRPDGRYVALTRRILDMCDEYQRKATFFVVGRVAEAAPDLIKEIALRGHEIAYHSHNHVPLTEEEPVRFLRESKADKNRLEELTGKKVVGFRAPRFSLTPKTMWATDILVELGFQYSSSIMPTSLSLFGFPNAPCIPFRWPNGLVELPLPVTHLGRLHIPYLGGIYLYALPFLLARLWSRMAHRDEVLWTYTHPYDFDREERFEPMPDTPTWVSFVLWASRFMAEKKIRKILSLGEAPTLSSRFSKANYTKFII